MNDGDAEYADQGTKLAHRVLAAFEYASDQDLFGTLTDSLEKAGLELPEDQGTGYFALMTAFMNEMQQALARDLEENRALDAGEYVNPR